jgi:hypothetical protein
MPDRTRRPVYLISLLAALAGAGCFRLPDKPVPQPEADLAPRVRAALAGHQQDALTYAGLYAVLADRFESRAYATTAEAAAVASRVAETLAVPGLLKQVVGDELNPLIGKPQPLSPDLAAKAAAKLRALSAACREAAR